MTWGRALREGFSDLRFTDASRVPFPFARAMREKFELCTVVTASRGPYLQNLDGAWTLDVSGSYGLNVAGFDRYKEWIQTGWDRVRDLGPVLGPIHPVVGDNIDRLKRLSHQDEVSFHMSGTEAVMAAVRLARFNTGRKRIVCFSGAYHGWWDGVQPGLGSERPIDDCRTLKDLHPASLQRDSRSAHQRDRRRAGQPGAGVSSKEIRRRQTTPCSSRAACARLPALSSGTVRPLAEGTARRLHRVRRAAHLRRGLHRLSARQPGGAQEFFRSARGYGRVAGKTVAGGMPIGVVCGPSRGSCGESTRDTRCAWRTSSAPSRRIRW